ncbi:protein eva-1 homolog C isoform X2 [Ammospiza nelsoni]|uniref:protein eva-1 homolog C isoform X2 n=1 Tax=Ammospiza nelsoni TaxID=2857394 RepID=UPI002869AFC3|nr:protein eva-1 homolog C isoform X2 [Ammospiza nelsoni]
MRDGHAGLHPRRAQVEPGRLLRLLSCVLLLCGAEVAALADFSGYLTKLLQNHTAQACDGQHLSLHCPRHSTISVQSAFYGQDPRTCGAGQPGASVAEPRDCVAPTSLQKVLDECQNLRSCQLLVNSRVFGPDLCPGTTKFLLVSFKCKPTEYKTKSACENQELKLHCQESKFLIIYSATYGRWAHEESVCSTQAEHSPPFDCLSYTALEVLSKRCYGKQRCKVIVTSRDFGSPCLPGVPKSLNVSYACGGSSWLWLSLHSGSGNPLSGNSPWCGSGNALSGHKVPSAPAVDQGMLSQDTRLPQPLLWIRECSLRTQGSLSPCCGSGNAGMLSQDTRLPQPRGVWHSLHARVPLWAAFSRR